MTEQEQSATLHIMVIMKELPGDLAAIMTEEWNSRTKLGKALYPLWVVDSTMQWLALLFFLAIVGGMSIVWKAMNSPIPLRTHKEKND